MHMVVVLNVSQKLTVLMIRCIMFCCFLLEVMSDLPHSRGRGNVTALEFYSYHLMVRPGVHHLQLSERLFHQYIVDMSAKIEQQRLNYIQSAEDTS